MWGWEDLSERAVIELRIYSGHLLDLGLGHQKRSPSSQAFDVVGGDTSSPLTEPTRLPPPYPSHRVDMGPQGGQSKWPPL